VSITFSRTREELRDMILRKLRKLAVGQTPSNDDIVIVYEALDLYLKQIHRLGVFWGKVSVAPLQFTVSANTTAASASNDVLFPILMTAVNGSDVEPIDIVGYREFNSIENKAETGTPTKALHRGSSSFWFWPVPVSNTTINLTYEKVIDDTAAATPIDANVSLLMWIRDVVAYHLADDFRINEQTVMRWAKEADYAEKQIRKLSVQRVDSTPVEFCNF
jgi:hypothetical protein